MTTTLNLIDEALPDEIPQEAYCSTRSSLPTHPAARSSTTRMSKVVAELKYSAEHEWVATDGPGPAGIGISVVAADALGDIVYVDLPEVGAAVTAGETCAEVESTKSVSDLIAPVTGEVTEVNAAVVADPALINSDPYGAGWLFRVAVESKGPLLSVQEYASANGGEL